MNLPSGPARIAVAVAVAIWVGALVGPAAGVFVGCVLVAAGAIATAVAREPALLLVVLLGVGVVSGGLADSRKDTTLRADLPQGRGVLTATAATDALPYGEHYRFVAKPTGWTPRGRGETSWRGPHLAVIATDGTVSAGDVVSVSGLIRDRPDVVRGRPVAGRVTASDVSVIAGPSSPLVGAGNAVRDRVDGRLAVLNDTPEAALLAGFLIGDIALLPQSDNEALRRAGLTHFVAVSGSNVALVLGAWWLVLGPLGAGNRIRAVTGLVVLMVFVVATRWESSVIRAATMAALVMGGRALGVPLDAWTALGGAVALLLTVSGDLAYNIGFQLSVVATAGVLTGIHIWSDRRPRLMWSLLAATVSAQLAVMPLLLIHFGTVPLLAPVANLVAAPLVTAATACAGCGVIFNWDLPLHLAELLGGMVLNVARTASGWPQLSALQVLALAIPLVLTWRTPLRWMVVIVAAVVVGSAMIPPGPPSEPTIVFLDIGQGDAVLLRDPSGAVALVDGGRDPVLLREKLREYGVGHIDLLIATHGDADHVGGFDGLSEFVDIGHAWVPSNAELGDLLETVVDQATERGAMVETVAAGVGAHLGDFDIELLGPQRRYAADNDGSIVSLVSVGEYTVLLPGDIGAVAQRELGPVRPDLLMVPHHGAATSDLNWLMETVGDLAVISVGPNTYGHPAPEVLDALMQAGERVLTTWDEGDIAIALR